MNRTAALLETLKKYLKAKGMTYKQLADEMKLSEASVKRMFSKHRFSLSRLDEICRILDIDFYDLVLMDKQRNLRSAGRLTNAQEESLLKDDKLWIFLYFLLNGWSVSQVVEDYQYSEPEAVRMLGKLERLGLLEVHPYNRVRLLIPANAFWQNNGRLWQATHKMFVDDFMDCSFSLPNERLEFIPGQFSEASLKIIRKKIETLVKEYYQLAEMDSALPIKGRYSTGLFIGFRPWVYSVIANLRRRRKTKTQSGKARVIPNR